MGDRSEPPRKVDLSKWDATWERIRANQARQRAEAAAAELRGATITSDNETEGEEAGDGLQAR